MKSNKLNSLLVFAVVLTLAGTGCKHKPVGVTQLPSGSIGAVGGEQPSPPPGLSLSQPDATGTIPLGAKWDPADPNLVRDASTLAADTVHFDYDSSVVKKSEQPQVDAVVAAMQSDATAKLQIEGHCDERGTEEYNRSLGERRALALREALAKAGIDPDRIQTISYGEDRPEDAGHNEAAWQKNRRGVFVMFHPKQ